MTQFKIGDKVRVNPNNDNENYNKFRDKVLTVEHVSTNSYEHPGFDEAMCGQALYDLKNVPLSLYDYELIPA